MGISQLIQQLLSEDLDDMDFDKLLLLLEKQLALLPLEYELMPLYLAPDHGGVIFNLSSQYALLIKRHSLKASEITQLKNLIESIFSYVCSNSRHAELARIEDQMNATENGYWDWDAESNTVYYSHTWKAMLGYNYDDIDNEFSEWHRLLHPDDYKRADTKLGEFFENPERKFETEFRLKCKHGGYKWILSRGKALTTYEDGSPKRIVGTHVDIDHVKMLEQQLQDTESDLSINQQTILLMGDRAKIGAWSFDITNNQLFWSSAVKEIHAVAKDYEPNVENAIFFYKEGWSRDKIQTCVAHALEENVDYDEELIIIDAKGNEKWVRALGKPFSTDEGVVLYGIFQDITDHKNLVSELERARANAEEKSQRLSLAVHSAHIGFWDLDLISNKLSWNDEMFSIYGQSSKDFNYSAKDWKKHLHPDDLIEADKLMQGAIKGTDVFDTEFRILAGNNAEKIIQANAEVVRDPEGKALRLVGINFDVTEQRTFEKEQQNIARMAEEASLAKSQFLANMSHEIRTPLNGIIGMLGLLKKGQLNQENQSQVTVAECSAHSLLDILNDILDLTKIESGKFEIETIDFNLFEAFRSIIHTYQLKADDKSVELILDVNFDEDLHIHSDPTRLKQVITNLLSNAIKFTHQGSILITSKVKKSAEGLLLSVAIKDTGIGIPKEQKGKLFRRFSQVDATTTREYGGTGLGLSISKSFIELLGGTISFTSIEDEGSTFTFTIPIDLAKEKEVMLEPHDLVNRRVLVVDKSEANRLVLRTQLTNMQCEWLEAANYQEVIDSLKQYKHEIDIVILARDLGQDCGLDLSSKLKEIKVLSNAFFLLTSSISDIIELDTLKKQGIHSHIKKPISEHQLFLAMSRLLDKSGDSIDIYETEVVEQQDTILNQLSHISNVIVAEDNKVNQLVIKGYLSGLVSNITIANNGQELIDSLKDSKTHYELILMDCEMPIMDGYEATRQIRKGASGNQYTEVPIIALTAKAFKEDKERCLETGMNGFVSKPTTPEKLINEILTHVLK